MRGRGETAARWRMKYAGLAPAERERQLRKLWRDVYDFITPQTVTAGLDNKTGDYVLTMTGSARMAWVSSGSTRWYELDRARVGWKPDIERDGTLLADAPFAFDYPDWWANRETVHLPRGGQDFALQANDVDETVGGLYAFHRKVALKGDTVTMENDTRALKAELPAADAPKVRDRMAELSNHGQFIRLPATYVATDADMAALADDKPALAHAWLMRGAVAFDKNDMAGAIPALKAALAADDKQLYARSLLAFAYAARHDPQALAEADATLAADDKQDMAWAAKGLVALQAGKMAEALSAFDRAIALDDRNPRTLTGRGTAHLALGHYAPALADLDAAVALAPELPLQPLRAVALSMLGRNAEALATADKALAAMPDNRETRWLRAQMRKDEGDTTGALADADWLVAHGGSATDYFSRAQLRPREDRAAQLGDLDKALQVDPNHVGALILRARINREAGNGAAADADLARAAKLAPDSLPLAAARMDALAEQGQIDNALRLASQVQAAHAKDPEAYNLVCWFKVTHGAALDTAGADCDTALRLAPTRPDFLDSRGFLHLRQGDAKAAIADYDAALRISPNLIASLYGRGLAYARLGERDRALADLSRARSLLPGVDKTWAGYGLTPPAGFGPASTP
jgi:tetratricopeptide (TPR) repeat protein